MKGESPHGDKIETHPQPCPPSQMGICSPLLGHSHAGGCSEDPSRPRGVEFYFLLRINTYPNDASSISMAASPVCMRVFCHHVSGFFTY